MVAGFSEEICAVLARRMYHDENFVNFLRQQFRNGNKVLSGQLPLRAGSYRSSDKGDAYLKAFIRSEYSVWLQKQVWN